MSSLINNGQNASVYDLNQTTSVHLKAKLKYTLEKLSLSKPQTPQIPKQISDYDFLEHLWSDFVLFLRPPIFQDRV